MEGSTRVEEEAWNDGPSAPNRRKTNSSDGSSFLLEKKNSPSNEAETTGAPPDEEAPAEIHRFPKYLQWIIYLSKVYLDIKPFAKAVFYFALAFICHGIAIIVDPYRDFYIFRKESFLNQWFVKLSWGWTFWLLLVFFVLVGFVEGEGKASKVLRSVTRLVIGTAVWFGVTTTFVGIERQTGSCSRTDYASRKDCLEAGEIWSQFDISGHAFLLIYCALLILEESRGFFEWEKHEAHRTPGLTALSGGRRSEIDDSVKKNVIIAVRILSVAIALLGILWDGMLVITLLFYHSFIQRILGITMGVAAWFLTYQVWFPNYFPGLPGEV